MNILVTGASGFIASQIVTDLLAAGHNVTCCVRNPSYTQKLFPTAKIITCNFIKDQSSADWINRVEGIDVVINCVGILYHFKKKIIWAIHYDTPRALFDACVQKKIKKIIQISALGIDQTDVEYAKSKKAADDYLNQLPIQSIVLRPSLVYGRGSYGGTSLFRGLAGLPLIIPMPGKGAQEFQPIHLEDLSKGIVKLVENSQSENKLLLHAVGSKRINLKTILVNLRKWLGFSKGMTVSIPFFMIKIASWFGDFFPYSTLNNTSYKMLRCNNISTAVETKKFHEQIGFIPRDFVSGLYTYPSTVQDRWHARLYFLKPLLQLGIAFVWIFTAITSLFFFPIEASYQLLAKAGVSSELQPFLFYSACILDGLLGLAMLIGYRLGLVCLVQIMFLVFYTGFITFALPYLWLDPFAPIAKNIPLIIATIILFSLESDR